jgi:DUF971 family protein
MIGDSSAPRPLHIDLDRDRGLTIRWDDGASHFVTVAVLRRHSPSAEQRELRAELARNPLAVLPAGTGGSGPLRALAVEAVGHYAVRIRFSDGHDTGIYSWKLLRELCEQHGKPPAAT